MNSSSEQTNSTDSRPEPPPGPSAAPTQQPASPLDCLLTLPPVEPWADPVDGHLLLNDVAQTLRSFVFLPQWAPETLALWILHTYAFQLRDVTTYIGVESPEHRCGKSTLVTVLSELAHRAIVASNVSSPAFFRVIEQLRPALLIDEADTFLHGNDELRGILNSGYLRKTAYVLRAVNQPAQTSDNPEAETQTIGLAKYSCWCPKVIARIGQLPPTLADRCIVLRMQRKTAREKCQRLRSLNSGPLRRQCARFALDHAAAISAALPQIPPDLNDRAADIWEPLFALADLAQGSWPSLAREAALSLTATTHDNNPIASLLLDIFLVLTQNNVDRIFSQTLIQELNRFPVRPWTDLRNGKPVTDLWLAQQLRPYGIRSRNLRINGTQAKGYFQDDMMDVFRRYISKSELNALKAEAKPIPVPQPEPPANPGTNN